MTAELVDGKEFLERYFRDCNGSNVELRALHIVKNASSKVVHQKAYTKIDALLADAGRLAEKYNVYFNTAALNGGFDEEHAVSVPALRIDQDFKNGITEAEARQMLSSFPLRPSAIVHTGGGLQPYWFLSEPAGRSDFHLVKNIIKALIYTFRADPGAKDIPRIFRLPLQNSMNFKPVYVPPRPVVLAREDWHPEREYSLSDFAALLPIEGDVKTPSAEKIAKDGGGKLPIERLAPVFEKCAELDGMRRNAIEAGRLLPEDKPGEHLARIRMMNMYRAFEGGQEHAVREIFSHLDDFNLRKTEDQAASLHGGPPPCVELCPASQCEAIKARGKQSPIAFAYERRTEREGVPDIRLPAVSISPKAPLFASLSTLLANQRPQRWLVKRLIESPSTVMVFGPSGGGKSFIVVDLAGAAATSGQWAGRDVVGGPVFYIAGEGRNGLLRRFQAWQLKRKETIPEGRLFLSVVRIELNASGAAEVALEVEHRAKEIGEYPALIVVDTLARAMPAGGDENSTKDMMAFVKEVDQIRDRFDCVAVIVHHAGIADDKRARGSTSLKAAMDAELCIARRGAARTAEWTKLKDLPEEPAPQEFTLEPELLGQDEDGNLITSAVVAWKGRTTLKAITTTKAESLGLDTLRTAIAGGDKATLYSWRPIFYAKHWGDNDDAKQKAFKRIRESLAGKGLIHIEGEHYSIPPAGGRT